MAESTTSTATPSQVAARPSATNKGPSPMRMLKLLLPKLPLIARVAVMHVLHLSEASKYLDLRSEVILSVVRSMLEPSVPRAISTMQGYSIYETPIKGRLSISKYAAPAPPEVDVRDAVMSVVADLANEDASGLKLRVPDLVPVEAEWTGYRAKAAAGSAQANISEQEKYNDLLKDCTSPITILYFHGGAYYLMDPGTHRPTVKVLAKITGGRAYSVRYRLAPQHPFPAALIDALMSYFTLLYPPPRAFHKPVKPEHIVFSGDSAGGNLAFALLQLLLQLRRKDIRIMWHGELREVPLPAGTAGNSPWLDLTHSSPSFAGTELPVYDYLPKPESVQKVGIKDCHMWPADPPRRLIYVDDHLVTHPLATLLMSKSWEGSPPVYICTGWEMIGYEDKWFAKKLAGQGVKVKFEEYEAMPHCFAMIFPGSTVSRRCYSNWANFIRDAVISPESFQSSATLIKAKSLKEQPLRFEDLGDASEEEIRARIEKMAAEVPDAMVISPKL